MSEKICPYFCLKGQDKYQYCCVADKCCHCDGDEERCENVKEWDEAGFRKYLKEIGEG